MSKCRNRRGVVAGKLRGAGGNNHHQRPKGNQHCNCRACPSLRDDGDVLLRHALSVKGQRPHALASRREERVGPSGRDRRYAWLTGPCRRLE